MGQTFNFAKKRCQVIHRKRFESAQRGSFQKINNTSAMLNVPFLTSDKFDHPCLNVLPRTQRKAHATQMLFHTGLNNAKHWFVSGFMFTLVYSSTRVSTFCLHFNKFYQQNVNNTHCATTMTCWCETASTNTRTQFQSMTCVCLSEQIN